MKSKEEIVSHYNKMKENLLMLNDILQNPSNHQETILEKGIDHFITAYNEQASMNDLMEWILDIKK